MVGQRTELSGIEESERWCGEQAWRVNKWERDTKRGGEGIDLTATP